MNEDSFALSPSLHRAETCSILDNTVHLAYHCDQEVNCRTEFLPCEARWLASQTPHSLGFFAAHGLPKREQHAFPLVNIHFVRRRAKEAYQIHLLFSKQPLCVFCPAAESRRHRDVDLPLNLLALSPMHSSSPLGGCREKRPSVESMTGGSGPGSCLPPNFRDRKSVV